MRFFLCFLVVCCVIGAVQRHSDLRKSQHWLLGVGVIVAAGYFYFDLL